MSFALCAGCRIPLYAPRLARNLGVCPECGHHHRLGAPERIAQLLDPHSVRPLPAPAAEPAQDTDPGYAGKLARARAATGLSEAVVCVRGTIEGLPVIAAVMDFRFLGGSLSAAVGELVTRAAETALAERTPLLLVPASGGARMQEGTVALMQMAKTSQALAQLDEAGILTVAVITDPTYGGVAASYASLCDVTVAEPGARLGFAGPRVIAQTIGRALPPSFQTAEYLLEHGLIDAIRPRPALRGTLARLLTVGTRREGPPQPSGPGDAVLRDPAGLPERDAWETVRQARNVDRPTTVDYLGRIFTDVERLHGDRIGGDCPAIVGALARLDGIPVLVLGHQKGHTARELAASRYGMPTPAGYRKAARLMRLAAKLGLPVVTLVDTPGAYPGPEAEEQGQAIAIAENLRLMAGLPVPVVAVVTGEGGSGGALALALANRVLVLSGAVYSVISPEGCAAILHGDPVMAPQAARSLRLTAPDLLRLGIVDGVVPEPPGGAHTDTAEAARLLRAALVQELRALLPLNPPRLIVGRHARFRRFGAPVPQVAA
ncbi:carboxyltransferase subunit alpha [Dactylosporangium sp. NPDC048998]|uniref:carboxyltransferase subunit alpha n=1 Tax=Dactylosporangium sp. NPDC048998 TaxID=3363976 RepID=UPI003717D190